MLSPTPEAAEAFIAAHPDIEFVDAIFADLCGIIRGKRYPVEDLHKILMKGITIPASVYLLSVTGSSHDPLGMGISDGDPDRLLVPIEGMLKPVPWAERPLAQVYTTMLDRDGSPYRMEPRNVLARVVQRFTDMGLRPVVALELEFYLIDKERTRWGAPRPPISPLTRQREQAKQVYSIAEVEAFADLLGDITAACDAQDIPYGAITAEYAPGQFEINLDHVADPLLAADHAVLLKRVVKGCARRHGIQATFAPKPYPEETGSGLHAHVSLVDAAGGNVLDDGAGGPGEMLRHAIGGCLKLIPPSMAIFAPGPNGFRRYRANNFVPVSRCWGLENRSAAVRVPMGDAASRRIEHRIAGADANPYLALACILASMHHGIVRRLDPGPPITGNGGVEIDPAIPLRPYRALEMLMASDELKEYFGADYVEAYVTTKTAEMDEFYEQLSPTEYAWYLQAD